MNDAIAKELEVLWADFDKYDVNQKLDSSERIGQIATKEDLPQLISALKSERNDFWTRELLAHPISELGGSKYLQELFDALEKNYEEGHDNDNLNFFLTEIADSEPQLCKKELLRLIDSSNFKYKNRAKWLLEFCD